MYSIFNSIQFFIYSRDDSTETGDSIKTIHKNKWPLQAST
jgi:hypothetical protein